MTYCYNCGYKLVLGVENFCPNCGTDLKIKNSSSTNISNTKGEVIGTGTSGTGNITGKQIDYNVQGNVINLQLTGDISKDVLLELQKIMAVPNKVDKIPETTNGLNENKRKAEESSSTHKKIHNILDEVNIIEEKAGTKIEEIQAGDLQISRDELSLKEVVLKGNEEYYKKNYHKAIEWYDKAIEIDNSNFDVWYNKGYALFNLGKSDEAKKCYDRAIQIDPNRFYEYTDKAWTLVKLGKNQEAIEHFDKAIQLNPNDVNAWMNKAAYFAASGEYEKSFESFTKVVNLDPDNFFGWYNRGTTLNDLSKYEEAIEDFNRAIELNAENSNVYVNKGLALYHLGKIKEAEECYDNAIQLDPNSPYGWNEKALVLCDRGEYAEANDCCDKAIECYDMTAELDPSFAISYTTKSACLIALEKYEEAIRYCEKAIQIDPNDADAWNNKGIALEKLGKNKEAQDCYNKRDQLRTSKTQ